MACRTFVPQPGIEPKPPAVKVQSFNHQNAREVSKILFLFFGRAMQHAESSFSDQGLNLRLLQWKRGILATELPGSPLTASKK